MNEKYTPEVDADRGRVNSELFSTAVGLLSDFDDVPTYNGSQTETYPPHLDDRGGLEDRDLA